MFKENLKLLILERLGLIPKAPQPGDMMHLYKFGRLGHGESLGNHHINKWNGNRHYSVSSVKTVKLEPVGNELGDQNGTPVSKLRQSYDMEKAPKRELNHKPGEPVSTIK